MVIDSPVKARPKIFYGWWIAVAGSVAGAFNLGLFQLGLGTFVKDVQTDMGWTMAAVSFAFSLKQFESGSLAAIWGYIMDRVGPRPMATIGTLVMSSGLIVFSRMESLMHLYLAATLISLGQGMGASSGYNLALVHWFKRKRGTAAGIVGIGQAVGYTMVVPISFLMLEYGWRTSAFVMALVFCVVSLTTAQFIRRRPDMYGLRPDGDPGEPLPPVATDRRGRPVPASSADSATVGEAIRSRAFWMLLISNAAFSFTTTVNHVHQIPQMRSRGFSVSGAAFVVALYGVEQGFGRFLSGWVGDKVGRHRLFRVSFLLLGIGWVAFAFVTPSNLWTVALYLATMGLGHATHNGSAQSQVADYFGPARFATIRGIMSSVTFIGGVSGPLFAGLMYDRFGGYSQAFVILGPCIAVGFPAMLLAGDPKRAGLEDLPKKKKTETAATPKE